VSTVAPFGSRLNASDALLWTIEQDPALRTTIMAVSMLDRSPDWRRLRRLMARACEQAPRFRQRIVERPVPLGPPRWEIDEHFDLDYHLRHVEAPDHGGLRTVLDLTAPAAGGVFDRARPLWEFTLVDGLAGGQAAFVQRVHHAFTDGVGGMELARLLLDRTRDARPRRLAAPAPKRPANPLGPATASVRAVRALGAGAVRAVSDPLGFAGATVRETRSLVRLLAPVSRPLSPVMIGRGLSRRLDAFDVPLADLRRAAHAAGCSLNDAFLASVAGGMRRYHRRHGTDIERMRVTMPISIRRPGDPLGSNRFIPARVILPVATPDPADRMREIGVLAGGWRDDPALRLTDPLAAVLDRLPAVATTTLFGSMLKGVDLVATNIPGFTEPAFLAGAEVVRHYAFGPPSGAAFSVALMSHLDHCCIGINADTVAVPDADVLGTCMRDGFDEVLTVGGPP
jgi:WS/DGAT/MGAT family acyltransferase